MKIISRYIISWFLLVVLFISTSGFSIFSHACSMSGVKDVNIKKVESCCANEKARTGEADTNLDSDCCKTEVVFVKFNFDALLAKIEFQNADYFPLIYYADIIRSINTSEFSFYNFYQNLPPPKTGRTILLQKDLLRI